MSHLGFIVAIAGVLLPLIWWLGRILPGERWQILAAIPWQKIEGAEYGRWQGINLTSYGLLLASGCLIGVSVFFFLLAAIGVPFGWTLSLSLSILGASVAASKLVARLVEGRENTFTVAGAATIGLYLAPLLIWLGGDRAGAGPGGAIMPMMAALAIAYALGEGIGRLACISFGCCYGKPLSQLGPLGRCLFSRFHTRYFGKTKKIAYAADLSGVAVVPVQTLSAFVLVGLSLSASWFFLEGDFRLAFIAAAGGSMSWRLWSEQLRADYRGGGRLSAYQWMSIANIAFCLILALVVPAPVLPVQLAAGLAIFQEVRLILYLQLLWLAMFFYFGLSRVTGSTLAFHVRRGK